MNRRLTKAYERSDALRQLLLEVGGVCREVTEDKAGILWERWVLPSGTSAILFATPSWWDVFLPAHDGISIDDTFMAVRAAATRERKAPRA